MNRKGFTLIEIIAVIVILGIIMLIAVPSVSSQIVMARKGSYSTDIKSFMETAQGNYVQKEYGNYLEDGELLLVPISRLKIEKGDTTNSPFGKYIQNESYVIIKKSNKSQRSYINIMDTSGYGVVGKQYDEVNRKVIEQLDRDAITDLKDYYQCENSSTVLNRNIPYYFQDVEYHPCSEEARIDCDDTTIPVIRMCQDRICTITYNLNGGHLEVSNPTIYDDTTRDFILNEPVREGYRFTGWTGSNGTVPQYNVIIGAETSCQKSYVANWVKTSCTTVKVPSKERVIAPQTASSQTRTRNGVLYYYQANDGNGASAHKFYSTITPNPLGDGTNWVNMSGRYQLTNGQTMTIKASSQQGRWRCFNHVADEFRSTYGCQAATESTSQLCDCPGRAINVIGGGSASNPVYYQVEFYYFVEEEVCVDEP